jgi:O-antigen/teichoic acid export membrane protein
MFGGVSVRRRLLSGSAWALAGRLTMALTGLLGNALLARLLSPEDLGVYFLAYSMVWLGGILGSLGLNQAAVRFVAESLALGEFRRARGAVISTLALGLVAAAGVALVYLLLGGFVGENLFQSPALSAVAGLVAGWTVAASLQNLFSETFRGFGDIRLAAVFGGPLPGVLLVVSLIAVLLISGRASLSLVMLIAAGTGLASALFAGWMLRRKVGSLPGGGSRLPPSVPELLRVSWPLAINGAALFALTQVDIWVLGAFRPGEEVAVYGTAARLVFLVAVPLLVVNAVVPPLIAGMNVQGRTEELERAVRAAATLAGIPAMLALSGFVLFSGPVLELVYGDYYRAGAVVLILLSVGKVINVWAGSCGIVLTMTGHQAALLGITLLSGLLTVSGAAWAVQDYGAEGVAVVTSSALALQNLLMLIYARRRVGIWTHATLSLKEIRGALSK